MNKLVEIYGVKRQEVEAARSVTSLSDLKAMAGDQPSTRGFRNALANANGLGLIAEVKKASPSRGLIRPKLDPALVASAYEKAGAQCLSVLTDEPFFQGSPENLKIAKRVTQLPCLRKDFIEDEYQVYEARAWGADAVLLIASWLGPVQIEHLMGLAKELGMDSLVEIHTAGEAEMALSCHADMIGINNRNLGTLKEDLSMSEELMPKIAANSLAVAESGFKSRMELDRVEKAGAKAALIGTIFCLADDIESKVREVMGWPSQE